MIVYARTALLSLGLAGVAAVIPAFGQAQPAPPATASVSGDRAAAYYNFAMAHLNAELAGAYGNRGEYVNKAIDFYRQAMKLDPRSSYIGEELADFYVQAGQLERATALANDLIKANPDSVSAHKILARIYSRQIGDPDQGQGKIDQAMLKSAIEQYKRITDLDPKDSESFSMLARLYRVSHDEASAEGAYRAILQLDPNDDDALSGLAAVYADRGDLPNAIAMLKQAADKNPDARTIVTLAEFYEQNHEYSNAADTWQKALALTNDNVKVQRQYAADLRAAGRNDEALKAFQQLAADDPKNVELHLRLVEILGQKRDFAGAREELAKARAVDNSIEVRFADAELLDAEGKTAQAITALEGILAETKKAQYTDPERAQRMQTLESLGRLEKTSGRTQDAVAAFRQIVDLNPAIASRMEVEVIDTLVAGKDFKGAKQTADAALKKFPGDKLIAMEHASLLGDLGQFDAAVNEMKAIPDSAKDRDMLIQIAQIQDKAKRFADETKTLDAAEALSSSDQEKQGIAFMRGAMFEREKNFDAAEQQFRKVIDADPNNAGALNYLGYMLADRGVRLDEAQQMVSKALDIDPGNGAYLDSLGWVHYHQNKLDMAADELRQALDRIGKDPTVHDHLGDVYFKQGKVREAIQQWEASVSEMKVGAPSEQDPEELAKLTKKLESARVRVAEKK
jgi:tetratricopeptide (TPR) repeat protein